MSNHFPFKNTPHCFLPIFSYSDLAHCCQINLLLLLLLFCLEIIKDFLTPANKEQTLKAGSHISTWSSPAVLLVLLPTMTYRETFPELCHSELQGMLRDLKGGKKKFGLERSLGKAKQRYSCWSVPELRRALPVLRVHWDSLTEVWNTVFPNLEWPEIPFFTYFLKDEYFPEQTLESPALKTS